MTFDDLWPTLVIPGEYDAMDELDQARWRGVIRRAFEAGHADYAIIEAANADAVSDYNRCVEDIDTARERIASLEAERDALKVDAEKYRALRNGEAGGWRIGRFDRDYGIIVWVLGTEADAAIDAAKGEK